MKSEYWSDDKPAPEKGQTWRRRRNGRLVTIVDPEARIGGNFVDVSYDMGKGRIGYTGSLYWHSAFELVHKVNAAEQLDALPEWTVITSHRPDGSYYTYLVKQSGDWEASYETHSSTEVASWGHTLTIVARAVGK